MKWLSIIAEFLMTYGWLILIIMVSIGLLISFDKLAPTQQNIILPPPPTEQTDCEQTFNTTGWRRANDTWCNQTLCRQNINGTVCECSGEEYSLPSMPPRLEYYNVTRCLK